MKLAAMQLTKAPNNLADLAIDFTPEEEKKQPQSVEEATFWAKSKWFSMLGINPRTLQRKKRDG